MIQAPLCSSLLPVAHRWLEPDEAAKLEGQLDVGPRALANSIRAAATALKINAAPSEDVEEAGAKAAGGRKQGGTDGQGHFVRAKELESEVQRLHNEVKKRDREVRGVRMRRGALGWCSGG